MDNPKMDNGVPKTGRSETAEQRPTSPTPQPAQGEADDTKTAGRSASFPNSTDRRNPTNRRRAGCLGRRRVVP